nr:MAG: hypothetical protein E4H34_04080 [Hyphomicrobiales bacterium]
MPAFRGQADTNYILGPEFVPSVEVIEVLSAIRNPAILHLEYYAAQDIKLFAVPFTNIAVNADHGSVVPFR